MDELMANKNNIKDMEFIIRLLNQYGNCGCGRKIVKKYGKEKLIEMLKVQGFECTLEIKKEDEKDVSQYPRGATYILWLQKKTLVETPFIEKNYTIVGKVKEAVFKYPKWKVLEHGTFVLNSESYLFVNETTVKECLERKIQSSFYLQDGTFIVEVI